MVGQQGEKARVQTGAAGRGEGWFATVCREHSATEKVQDYAYSWAI